LLTLKLNIKSISDSDFISNKVKQYNYAFHLLFKQIEESSNLDFINKIKSKFNLNDIEYRSLLSDVKSFYVRNEKIKHNKIDRINDLNSQIINFKLKPKSKKNIRKIFKLNNKIKYLNNLLNENIVFGGRKLLQQITHLYNKKHNISK
jgi:hypothetical protein